MCLKSEGLRVFGPRKNAANFWKGPKAIFSKRFDEKNIISRQRDMKTLMTQRKRLRILRQRSSQSC